MHQVNKIIVYVGKNYLETEARGPRYNMERSDTTTTAIRSISVDRPY